MVSLLFRYAYRMEFDGKEASFYFMDDAAHGFDAKKFVFGFQDSVLNKGLNFTIESDLGAELFIIRLPVASLFAALFGSVKCSVRLLERKIYWQVYEITQIPPARNEKLEAKPASHAGF